MNSTALSTLAAQPILSLVFAVIITVGLACIARECLRACGDAIAARRARRLRRERACHIVNQDAIFLTRR